MYSIWFFAPSLWMDDRPVFDIPFGKMQSEQLWEVVGGCSSNNILVQLNDKLDTMECLNEMLGFLRRPLMIQFGILNISE